MGLEKVNIKNKCAYEGSSSGIGTRELKVINIQGHKE